MASRNAVQWLGEEIQDTNSMSSTFRHYEKFKFRSILAGVGDYVLVTKEDAAKARVEADCLAARILSLYEDTSNGNDPYRAKVQWFSMPRDIPKWCLSKSKEIKFLAKEVIEDHRAIKNDVSITTFYRKCNIALTFTNDISKNIQKPLNYFCRYRLLMLSKREICLEPVLEVGRNKLVGKDTFVKTNSLLKRNILASKYEKKTLKNDTTKLSQKVTLETLRVPLKSNLSPEETLPKDSIEIVNDTLQALVISECDTSPLKKKESIKSTSAGTLKKITDSDSDDGFISTPQKKKKNLEIPTTPSTSKIAQTSNQKSIKKGIAPTVKTPIKTVNTFTDSNTDDGIKSTSHTPRRRATKKIKVSQQLTPTLPTRTIPIDFKKELVKKIKPLPGRERHLHGIVAFLRANLLASTSGFIYISGVPGTGKTETVNLAFKTLKKEVDLPNFQVVEMNGMKIANLETAYVQIYKQLNGKTVPWQRACFLLNRLFSKPEPRRVPIVLLVDKFDALCTRQQNVFNTITKWATHTAAQLIVLVVANTMDSPERIIKTNVTIRLDIMRLTFDPYTYAQLKRILKLSLGRAQIEPDDLELIARKVACMSGDARHALSLSTKALEIGKSRSGSVGLEKVPLAFNGQSSKGVYIRAMRSCAPAEKLILKALAVECILSGVMDSIYNCIRYIIAAQSEAWPFVAFAVVVGVEKTGVEQTTLSRMLDSAQAIAISEGRTYVSATQIRGPTPSQALAICSRLAYIGLLSVKPNAAEPLLTLIVSANDVYLALGTNTLTVYECT